MEAETAIAESQVKILIQPMHSVLECHGLTLEKDLSCYSAGRKKWILSWRTYMVIMNATSIIMAGLILVLHFTYNRGDIEALCMWLALHAMVLSSAVIYMQTLVRLTTVSNYVHALDELVDNMSLLNPTKRSQRYDALHGLGHRCLLLSYTGQVAELFMMVVHMSFGNHKIIFYDDLASVYNLKGSRLHYWIYVMLSVTWGLLGHSFIRLYTSLVVIICATLQKCFEMLEEAKSGLPLPVYLAKHEHICLLIREADLLFSPFFFVKLVRTFIIVVFFSRFLKIATTPWDNLFITYTILTSLLSLWYNTSLASKLNQQVYTSMDAPPTFGQEQHQKQDEDDVRHLLYIGRLWSNPVAITMWGFFAIGKGLIFTTVGTMITYIVILWQFG